MDSQTGSQGSPLTRTVFKYAARAALGAIVLYAIFGSHSSPHQFKDTRVSGNNRVQSHGTAATAVTYWSIPSSPQATVTPDHVQDADTPAPPTPEEQVSFESSPSKDGVKESVIDEDENMDEFLKKLFEEDGIPLPDDLKDPLTPPPAPKALSPEEEAEIKRLQDIETKEKRADITKRHTQWEKKVSRVGEEELMDLMERVKEMRQSVVDNMRTKPEMFNLLKTLQDEGFKQVENTDKYLQKIVKDGRTDEEVSGKWTKVVAKVQKGLDARTIETTTYLQNWYKNVMLKEKTVFEASADKIDKLADEAQADIGMDYAWLDDVSTTDWTRYHKLKSEAKQWIEKYESVYNATHVDMKENVVVTELIQVETAMMRVAADLNQALDQIRMRGDGWLKGEVEPDTTSVSSATPSGTTAQAEEAAPSPVEDVQETSAIPVPETSTHVETKHQEL